MGYQKHASQASDGKDGQTLYQKFADYQQFFSYQKFVEYQNFKNYQDHLNYEKYIPDVAKRMMPNSVDEIPHGDSKGDVAHGKKSAVYAHIDLFSPGSRNQVVDYRTESQAASLALLTLALVVPVAGAAFFNQCPSFRPATTWRCLSYAYVNNLKRRISTLPCGSRRLAPTSMCSNADSVYVGRSFGLPCTGIFNSNRQSVMHGSLVQLL